MEFELNEEQQQIKRIERRPACHHEYTTCAKTEKRNSFVQKNRHKLCLFFVIPNIKRSQVFCI